MIQSEWRPHKKQEAALMSTAFETLYGGSRGGGKTDAGMAWMLYPADNPQYRGLVVRKNYADLNDWLDRAEVMYSGMGAKFVNRDEIRFPLGAKILVGHLSDAKAYMKYQGHEYQRELIEELTQIPSEDMYLKLISSCRSTIPGLEAKVFATCNPGGPGHSWVKKRFVDPAVPEKAFQDKVSGRTRIYIPATVDDNPVLMQRDPDYVKFLDSLPPDLKSQWRYGSWDLAKVKGSIYLDEYNQAIKENRIGEIQVWEHEPVYVSWDLGISDEQVAWFYQIKGEEVRFIDLFHEHGKGFEYYVHMLREKGYKYEEIILPHDGTKRAPDSLRSFCDVLQDAGYKVRIIPRTKDKVRDINISRSFFPRLKFHSESCARGLEALRS